MLALRVVSWRKRAASAFLGRWLGKAEHDLVVELASSTAGRLDAEVAAVVGCDHFGYFEGMATAASVLDLALGRIWAQLDLAKVFGHLAIGTAGGTIVGVGKWVWINGIRVPAKPIVHQSLPTWSGDFRQAISGVAGCDAQAGRARRRLSLICLFSPNEKRNISCAQGVKE